jgi:hypothetical protein
MEKLNFSVNINAPREKVWNVLWHDSTYRAWTSVFAPGSHAVTDWKEGSKVLFLDGKGQGMVSKIAVSRPHEYLSFEHLGIVKDGVEDFESDEVKQWAGVFENYTLTESNGTTNLKIDMDSNNEWKDYFSKTWPSALEKIKELSENK